MPPVTWSCPNCGRPSPPAGRAVPLRDHPRGCRAGGRGPAGGARGPGPPAPKPHLGTAAAHRAAELGPEGAPHRHRGDRGARARAPLLAQQAGPRRPRAGLRQPRAQADPEAHPHSPPAGSFPGNRNPRYPREDLPPPCRERAARAWPRPPFARPTPLPRTTRPSPTRGGCWPRPPSSTATTTCPGPSARARRRPATSVAYDFAHEDRGAHRHRPPARGRSGRSVLVGLHPRRRPRAATPGPSSNRSTSRCG
jgi:hypothetical protein